MLNNLKFLGVMLLSILLLTNCTKDSKVSDSKSPGELVFSAIDPNTDKDGEFDIECDLNKVATYAKVVLEDEDMMLLTFTPDIFVLNGLLYTQSIKLDEGSYKIKEFTLRDENDDIVKATPMMGSEYAHFVMNPIDDQVDFTVVAFEKSEYVIEVLCFIDAVYDNFGFEWFEVKEMTVYEQCFFGDLCIYSPSLYEGSDYYLDGLVSVDEVAIFRIDVYRDRLDNPMPIGVFDNFEDGEYVNPLFPLCVDYADYDNEDNEFQFELWLYRNGDNGFTYYLDKTWIVTDGNMITAGTDGVVDFVYGDCAADDPDFQLPEL